MSFGDKIKRILRIMLIRLRRVRREKKIRIFIAVVCLVAGILFGNRIGQNAGWKKGTAAEKKHTTEAVKEKEKEIAILQAEKEKLSGQIAEENQVYKLEDLPWNLTLGNWKHKMAKGYRPRLEEIEAGYYVDTRIAEPLKQMLAAAKADGMRV